MTRSPAGSLRPLYRILPAILPVLLFGFTFGREIAPNYRWCAATSRGLACYAREAECRAATRGGFCEPRLVAEPAARGVRSPAQK